MSDSSTLQPPARRIYLDNAATSWPKPEEVYKAVERYQRELGAPSGRSGYAAALEVEHLVREARRDVARLFGLPDASQVIFTTNGTDSLNLAIHGCLREGDHVVTTVAEHNSVLRPLRSLEDAGRIGVTRVGVDAAGIVDPDAVRSAAKPRTRLIVVTHASNVTGALQPIVDIGRVAHEREVLYLVDAAQTAGHVPINWDAAHIDFLAAPGHKGLLGPLGTGILLLRAGAEHHLRGLRQGGTGTQSELDQQPDTLPHKFEAGSLNVPGIVGLGAGVAFLQAQGLSNCQARMKALCAQLTDGLSHTARVTIWGPRKADDRVGVVSISLPHYDPQEVAATLDGAYHIQVRAGLHCAPLMHRALGTLRVGGTVRFSIGAFTTPQDIDMAIQAIDEITAAALAG